MTSASSRARRSAAGRRLLLTVAALAVLVPAGGQAASAVAPRPHVPAAARQPAAASAVTPPPANGRFDYQIGGDYKPLASVQIVDRDRTGRPVPGRYNICYVNAFQTQAYQDRWWRTHHPHLLLRNAAGHLLTDPGWPGEHLLDTSTAAKRAHLASIEDRWLAGCARKGFQAVEPDNLDSSSRSHHQLTQADDFAFAKLLVAAAHGDGLAIAQKNDAERSAHGHRIGFDFAIAEECAVYTECRYYLRAYGDEVIEIEYTDNPIRYYRQACAARGARISIILRDPKRHATRQPALPVRRLLTQEAALRRFGFRRLGPQTARASDGSGAQPGPHVAVDEDRHELRHAGGAHLAVDFGDQATDDGVRHPPRELVGELLRQPVYLVCE